jgi:hypothetical protein
MNTASVLGVHAGDLAAAAAPNSEALCHYDVMAMDRAVAILSWGRSGSLLLASYLDRHDDVLMLPELCGWKLYEFFDRHPHLTLREKLLEYPAYEKCYTRFFEGDFAISRSDYEAAVLAMLESHEHLDASFLESRRAFFIFLHLAYSFAVGRMPSNPRPLIVFAQHLPDDSIASYLVEDFPQVRFIHTVRDPISSYDRAFEYFLHTLVEHHLMLPYTGLLSLVGSERPQRGMESRSCAVRFEDLHNHLPGTMRDVAEWLGLPYNSVLLESTFNGVPYVVARKGEIWSGPRAAQTARSSKYLSAKDRALFYALFYEDFEAWNYPYARVICFAAVRALVTITLALLPLNTEITGARAIFWQRILPQARRGNLLGAAKAVLAIGVCRVKIASLFVSRVVQRCLRRYSVVVPLSGR